VVIRLGVETRPHNLVIQQSYRVIQGQSVQLRYVSSKAVTVRAWVRVLYDDGGQQLLSVPEAAVANDRIPGVIGASDVAIKDGWVTDALVEMPTGASQRGETYVRLELTPFGPVLLSDYCYPDIGQVVLGTHGDSGPGGGNGHLHVETIKADGAPAASTTFPLLLSNTVRKYSGISWYYECSADVASRVLAVVKRGALGATPPAMSGLDTWAPTGVTLTANQDGMIFADEKRSGINDNGSITILDQTTNPTPFPIWASADFGALVGLVFTVVDGEILDNDAIYAQIEDWLVL